MQKTSKKELVFFLILDSKVSNIAQRFLKQNSRKILWQSKKSEIENCKNIKVKAK